MTTRMTINGEPCELVTDFGQLRASDLIYVLTCNWCGKAPHRAMLLRPRMGPVMTASDAGNVVIMMGGFPMAPDPHRLPPGQGTMITQPTVAAQIVWRVIDPKRTVGDDVKQGELDATQPPERVVVVEQTGPLVPLKED